MPDPAAVLEELASDPHTLETLVAVLAGSQFLTEILLRNPGYLALLSARNGLSQIKSAGRMRAEARTATDPWLVAEGRDADVALDPDAALDALRRYQQRELLRIGAADLGGLVELASITGQLSRLAESVIQTALEIVAAKLNVSPAGFAVLAMGKLGGRELKLIAPTLTSSLSAQARMPAATRMRGNAVAGWANASSSRSPSPRAKASSTGSTCGCGRGAAWDR